MTDLQAALVEHGFTTLRLLQDWRRGAFRLRLSRDWDPGTDFTGYARDFSHDQLPCSDPAVAGEIDARGMIEDAGAVEELQALQGLMREGRHEMVVLKVHQRLGIAAWNNVHSSVLGRNNGLHAIRAGGIRRHELSDDEHEVLVDGLNLARAMSFKNAAAGIPFGGCKMTVRCDPFPLDDLERLGFIAYCIDSGCFMTGPDMGFAPELSDALRARFTRNILGGPGGSMGPTGTPTARGCFLAIEQAAQAAWGGGLEGRRVAIQGLGAVGMPLAELLAGAGARLLVADVDARRIERARELGGAIEVVDPAAVMAVECDVLSPCAMGGILDAAAIDALRCRMVYGSANNQLAALSEEQERALAERLQARGILYQPDWTHNTAGVMAGYEEYLHQEDARMERVEPRLERVCRDGTRELLAESARTGQTPTALAYARVERLIYPGAD